MTSPIKSQDVLCELLLILILAFWKGDWLPNVGVISARKQPKQARARVTVDAILEAAAQIIRRDGLSGLNTNAIARRAGVSIGSLYQYFPNKDALMAALIDQQQRALVSGLERALELANDASLVAKITALIDAAIYSHTHDGLLATALDHEEARLPVDDRISQHLSKASTHIAEMLRQHRDEVRVACLSTAAHTVPQMVRAIVDFWANRSPSQIEVARAEALRATLGYLGINLPADVG